MHFCLLFYIKKCHLFSTYVNFVDLKVFELIPFKNHCMDIKGKNTFSKKCLGTRLAMSLSTLISFHSQKPCRLNIFHIWTLIFLTLVLVPYFSASNLKKGNFFNKLTFSYLFYFILPITDLVVKCATSILKFL
jgi:hypothetical protein